MASTSNNNGDTDNRATTRTVISSNQDPNSIYYLHPSDVNSSQLVSVRFNGIGFTNWKRAMRLSLSARNKLRFVDDTLPRPDTGSPDIPAWERCNDLVCSWLLSNLDETISKGVLFFSDLEDRFGYASMAQVYALEQQLTDLNQNNKSVSKFFTKIKSLWDAMTDASHLPYCTCQKCTCDLTRKVYQRQQDHRLIQFMMKLNDRFSTIRGNMLMKQPLPTLSNAFILFSQEERHQELSFSVSSRAFYQNSGILRCLQS